jgi:hypothetical protein
VSGVRGRTTLTCRDYASRRDRRGGAAATDGSWWAKVRSRRGGADTTIVTAVWELPPRPPVRRKRVFVVLACVLAGVAALAVVVIQLVHIALEPRHALTAASKSSEQQLPTIQALPEATLLLPSSRVFLRHASPATILGGGASILTVAGVDETKAEIFAYFDQQLVQRGWQLSGVVDLNAPESWTKGRYAFVLSFAGPGDPIYPNEPQYTTTYHAGIAYERSPASSAPASPP